MLRGIALGDVGRTSPPVGPRVGRTSPRSGPNKPTSGPGNYGGHWCRDGALRGMHDSFPGANGSFLGVRESFQGADGSFLGMDGSFRGMDDSFLGADGSFLGMDHSFQPAGRFWGLKGPFLPLPPGSGRRVEDPTYRATCYLRSHPTCLQASIVVRA